MRNRNNLNFDRFNKRKNIDEELMPYDKPDWRKYK